MRYLCNRQCRECPYFVLNGEASCLKRRNVGRGVRAIDEFDCRAKSTGTCCAYGDNDGGPIVKRPFSAADSDGYRCLGRAVNRCGQILAHAADIDSFRCGCHNIVTGGIVDRPALIDIGDDIELRTVDSGNRGRFAFRGGEKDELRIARIRRRSHSRLKRGVLCSGSRVKRRHICRGLGVCDSDGRALCRALDRVGRRAAQLVAVVGRVSHRDSRALDDIIAVATLSDRGHWLSANRH